MCNFAPKLPKGLRHILFLIIASAAPVLVSAQFEESEPISRNQTETKKDSTKPVKRSDPASQYAYMLNMGIDTFYKWDSSFLFVHRYNKIQATGLPYADLGNTATPQHFIALNPFVQHGFRSGFNPYPLQNKNTDSFKFYKAAVPFSRFAYTQGTKGVFILDALHTQNLAKGWNVSIELSSVQNQDVYTASSQNHLHRGTMAGSHYVSQNGAFTQSVIFSWNRARRAENRGLLNDSFFYLPSENNVRTIGNYVPASSTAQSFYAQHHHLVEHNLYIGKQRNISVFHRFDHIKEKYEYNESAARFSSNDSAFYGTTPNFNPGAFKDSTVYTQWNNSAGIRILLNRKKSPIVLKTWASADYVSYNSIYKTQATTTFNQAVHAHALTTQKGFQLEATGHLYLLGWNQGDYFFKAKAGVNLLKNLGVFAAYTSQIYRQQMNAERFNTNYLRFYQNLRNSASNALSAGLHYNNRFCITEILAQTGTVSNYLYLNSNNVFQQINSIQFAQLSGRINLKLGIFYIDQRFSIQTHNSKENLPLPAFSGATAAYIQKAIFKKAMLARMGLEVYYFSKFNAYSYNPMLAQFKPGNETTGNYPLGDFYVSGEVKTVTFYLKMEHINQYATNYGFAETYNITQQYPIEPLRFRFGIVWKFYN